MKKIIFYLWLILIDGGIITYLFFPEKLSFSFMEETAGNYHIATLVIYYLILSFQLNNLDYKYYLVPYWGVFRVGLEGIEVEDH